LYYVEGITFVTSILSRTWVDANQRYLSVALSLVRDALKRYIADQFDSMEAEEPQQDVEQVLDELESSMPAPAALTQLCETFGLSPFERDVLLLCAGVEFDGAFAALCGEATAGGGPAGTGQAQGTVQGMSSPTFALALSVLPNAHWNAFTPTAPLRRWRLIEVGHGSALTLSPLRVDESILHYLAGAAYLDERLARLIRPLSANGELVPSHQVLAERLVRAWDQHTVERFSLRRSKGTWPVPVIQLSGEDVTGKHMIAATACSMSGLNLYIVSANALPSMPQDIEAFARLWEREAALSKSALLVDCDSLDLADREWAGQGRALFAVMSQFMEDMNGFLMISCRERLLPSVVPISRSVLSFDVYKPHRSEQVVTWQNALRGTMVPNEQIEALISQFNLSTATILAVLQYPPTDRGNEGNQTSPLAFPDASDSNGTIPDTSSSHRAGPDSFALGTQLWNACRLHTRARLDNLAQRIESDARWDDLILPEEQRRLLQEIVMHVRRRVTVYETWGFGSRGGRGLGMSVLFAGASGTGKTSAAEILAHELQLDLYRIDLSSTVSKYIGETEKNLRLIFDAAEEGGAILLFDEADALFGKRSEVKDSRDRYANIEVSYLLQRMEAYRGLAILTTNFKSALDTAFLRRIRFIVQFPFPDATLRAEIWRRSFPPNTPTENLDIDKLAKLHIAGGNIRNIAINAAFLAADAHKPIRMEHLLRAAHAEYAKLEKSPTESEFGGWL
jgi:AAA+ superfamily predicted ATPase